MKSMLYLTFCLHIYWLIYYLYSNCFRVSETEPQMESANQFNLDDDEEDPDDDLYI